MPFPAPRPGAASVFTPPRVAFVLTLLDGAWAFQALASAPLHPGSNVALVSLVVWVVFHLPAAILTDFLLRFGSDPGVGSLAALPTWSLVVLALLGLAQTFVLSWWLAARRLRGQV